MFKQIIFSILLLQALNTQCAKGCLRCRAKSSTDTTKVCKLCDFVGGYYMKDDGTCATTDQQNCQIIQHNNTCLVCSPGYYIANNKCVAVDVAKKVTNCDYYDGSQNCFFCSVGFLLGSNTCTAVTTKIDNCYGYSSQTLCSMCATNYYLSDDKKSCVQLPSDCTGYSRAECKSCKDGYLINKNLYKIGLY